MLNEIKNIIINLKLNEKITKIIDIYNSGSGQRRRILIIFFSVLFILDYLMFCLHTDKNIFDIFPSIPKLESNNICKIYFPSEDGKSVIEEERTVPVFKNDERLAQTLFIMVLKGSNYENTALSIPFDIFLRRVWVFKTNGDSGVNKTCVFDVEAGILRKNSRIIDGSEAVFDEALEKTIKENIPDVYRVEIIENGIPNKKKWNI